MTSRRPPWAVVVVAAVAVGFLVLPLVGLVQRAPWTELPSLLGTDTVRDALRLSLLTASLAMLASLTLGLPLAWVMGRGEFPGRSLLRALVTLPMVLPPVVGGAALLFALGRRGLLGQPLNDHLGVVLPYSTAGVVVAETFVALPFLVLTVEGALRSVDTRAEDAAATLGAGSWTTFRRVTLPTIAPSVVAGAVLCWARALGEFGATLTFAGNLQGRTQTMPLAVYLALERDREAALALSLVQVTVALVVLVALRHRWWPAPATAAEGAGEAGGANGPGDTSSGARDGGSRRPEDGRPRGNGGHREEVEAVEAARGLHRLRSPTPRWARRLRRMAPITSGWARRGPRLSHPSVGHEPLDAPEGPTAWDDALSPRPGMGLHAEVQVRLNGFLLDVDMHAAPGELVAVLGANGAGKTTLLRALAGLVPLVAGRVELDGQLLDHPAARRHVPAHRRPVGFVFQDLVLFEHLTSLDNVAFGLRCQGVERRAARARASDWLDRLGLADYARYRPAQLSRGQAQRVALARALVTEPRLLLLDEPLAAVDARAKAEVRAELRRHLDRVDGMRLLVTHDQAEAEELADQILVLESGRLR